MKSYAVVFAGVPGTSKSPIANYLSIKFNLPILTTDQIRFEVREDLRIDTLVGNDKALEEYSKRLAKRFSYILGSGHPFIFDGSMDRHWAVRKKKLIDTGYEWFMIDMELSRSFLSELFTATDRINFMQEHLDKYLKQHDDFMHQHADEINVYITDETFIDRLIIAEDALLKFVKTK